MLHQPPPRMASTLEAIGNTPLVQLQRVVPANSAAVVVKLEYFNPTSSYKDRMALAMIEGAERRGDLKPGMTVVELTGGSTGSSLAYVCALKGYHFRAVSSDAFAREKLMTMRVFGADLLLVPSVGGMVTPDLIPRMREQVQKLAAEPGTYWTDQFNNTDAVIGYMGIGQELLEQAGGPIDAFCGGVGTAGMITGVSRALREGGSQARIVALEPSSAPALTTGTGGAHHVEGIAVMVRPPMLSESTYDDAMAIDEGAAREMALRLAREEGIFGGTSSALNVTAAVKIAQELGPGHTVATVIVDSGFKYLAGDLYSSAEK